MQCMIENRGLFMENNIKEESRLKFRFAENDTVIKFDDTKFYRDYFNKLPEAKGVDFISVANDKIAFIEVKNCTGDEGNNLNVNVDGQACASMEQKDKILKSYNENNVALSFDEVANANQARIRELIQGKNIVYIYHNQVDARGDKPASENEVFNACAEAIEEIHKLVKKLTGYVSAPKFFITADHGFLYKRDRLQEFDKD